MESCNNFVDRNELNNKFRFRLPSKVRKVSGSGMKAKVGVYQL